MVIISECLFEMLTCAFTPCSVPKISVSLRFSAYFKKLMKDIGVLVDGVWAPRLLQAIPQLLTDRLGLIRAPPDHRTR